VFNVEVRVRVSRVEGLGIGFRVEGLRHKCFGFSVYKDLSLYSFEG